MEDEDLDNTARQEETVAPKDWDARLTQREEQLRALMDASYQKQRAVWETAREELKQRRFGPSRTETLAALAAAFGAPTRYKGLAATFSNVAPVLGKLAADKRAGDEERRTEEMRISQGLAGVEAAQAKGLYEGLSEIDKLRQKYETAANKNTGMQFKQAFQDPSGAVVGVWASPEGDAVSKTIAQLTPTQKVIGFDPKGGQVIVGNPSDPASIQGLPIPGYAPPPREYSSSERKELFDATDVVDQAGIAISNIDKALALNDKAYEGAFVGPGIALARLTGIGKETAAATSQLSSFMDQQVLSQLKATFGSQLAVAEGDWLKRASGFAGMTREERASLLREGRELVLQRARNAANVAKGIQGGSYGFRPSPSARPQSSGTSGFRILSRRPAGE